MVQLNHHFTPHDVIVFAIRDNHPDLWAAADDIADTVLNALTVTPCPQCYHTDKEHEEIIRAREFALELGRRMKERAKAEKQPKPPPRFVCRCGHPGEGCYCRQGG